MRILRKFCCFFLILMGTSTVCAQESDSNDYLAPYLVNWGDASKHLSSCQGQQNAANQHFLLGECPSKNMINVFYAGTALLHFTAANLLPGKYSRALKESSLNFQLSLLKDQSSLGMSYNF